jgi:hypothetical protein
MAGRLGILLAAADEIVRRCAIDLDHGRADLALVADRLEHGSRQVRAIAETRDDGERLPSPNVVRLNGRRRQ